MAHGTRKTALGGLIYDGPRDTHIRSYQQLFGVEATLLTMQSQSLLLGLLLCSTITRSAESPSVQAKHITLPYGNTYK